MAKKYEKFSKEELIKLLLKRDNSLEKVNKKIDKVQEKYQKEKARADRAERVIFTIHELNQALLNNSKELTKNIENHAIIVDVNAYKDVVEETKAISELFVSWINKAKSWLNCSPFTKGADVKSIELTQKETEEMVKAIPEHLKGMCGSLKNNKKLFNQLLPILAKLNQIQQDKALNETDPDKLKQTSEMQKHLANFLKNNNIEKKVKTISSNKKGRQSRKETPIKKEVKNNITKCSNCNSSDFETVHSLVERCLTQTAKLFDMHQYCEFLFELKTCKKCGQVLLDIPENGDVPVIPGRVLTVNEMVTGSLFYYTGLPINRLVERLFSNNQLGNETYYNAMHDYCDIYLTPLYNQIIKASQNAETIVADGTVFDCLQSQGRNVISKERGNNAVADDIRKTNYLLAITNPPHSEQQFTLFSYLNGRGSENIKSIINNDYKFKNLVVDGYPGYDSIIKERSNCRIQRCLIHFRRELIKASDPNNLLKEIEKISGDKELKEWLQSQIDTSNPALLVWLCIHSITTLYENENMIDYSNPNWKEEAREIRAQNKVIMDNIDEMMATISKDRIELSSNGKLWKLKRKNDIYGKACVYYMNHKDELRTFLDDVTVPPDSNSVEGSIRPITMLRHSVNWIRTEKGVNDLCIIYSVMSTLYKRTKSYAKIEQWLQNYSKALFKHCVEKRITAHLADGNTMETKLEDGWQMKEYSQSFDFSIWDPTTAEI